MNTPNSANSTASAHQRPHLPHFAKAMSDPIRWAVLAELSSGEPRMVKELAQKLGRSPGNLSKHMTVLRRAGVVTVGRGRLYSIPPQFLAGVSPGHVDFGHCLLRLAELEKPAA